MEPISPVSSSLLILSACRTLMLAMLSFRSWRRSKRSAATLGLLMLPADLLARIYDSCTAADKQV